MSGSQNKVLLIGHLGRDPEGRTLNSGNRVVTFSLATSESWRDKKSGERVTETEWHQVVIFNEPLGKIAEQYLKKGHKAYIVGAQKSRTYKASDGTDRRVTEVVLAQFRGELVLLEKSERPGAPEPGSYGTTQRRATQDELDDPRQSMGRNRAAEMIDDDIPF